MTHALHTQPRGFHVMAKPAGPSCNLRCAYCFYLEKDVLYPGPVRHFMSDETLEQYIRQYIASQSHLPEISFAWQGGEPTLCGLDFFKKAVALQQQHNHGKIIHNAIQTNGILIDDAWAGFLAEHRFLVGLSLDGPERFHDAYRRDAADRPTFKRVMEALEILKKHKVEFNILACVNRETAEAPEEVYRFLSAYGDGFIQFVPIVERSATTPQSHGLTLAPPDAADAAVTPWSVRPQQYGRFLEGVFDVWVRRDVGKVYVQLFDNLLEAWTGYEPSLCYFQECCGNAMILEFNGDVYACDHFVYPEYRLGNLHDTPLDKLADLPAQRAFSTAKRDRLPACCRACPVLFACRGECPKHRFLTSPEGEPGLNYLCEGYRYFLNHVDPYMRFMANELRHRRPPANVMAWTREDGATTPATTGRAISPNAMCPCGSGRKYKKCCGAKK